MEIYKETIEEILNEFGIEVIDIYISKNQLIIEIDEKSDIDNEEFIFAELESELRNIKSISLKENIISVRYSPHEEFELC